MKILGVIPARYQSSRMPGKPIADVCGKPMIWWVYKQALMCERLDDVVIATDDQRIYDVCKKYDMNALMTSDTHDTPTDRLCEVASKVEADYYLMIMGDEPLVNKKAFELILPEHEMRASYVAALTNTITEPSEVIDFSNQKVVTNSVGQAMLISRSPIPYPKGSLDIEYKKVTGIQLFSKEALKFYANSEKSALEKAEENDLMRFIENDIKVDMIPSCYKTISVDTPKDLELVRKIIGEKSGE